MCFLQNYSYATNHFTTYLLFYHREQAPKTPLNNQVHFTINNYLLFENSTHHFTLIPNIQTTRAFHPQPCTPKYHPTLKLAVAFKPTRAFPHIYTLSPKLSTSRSPPFPPVYSSPAFFVETTTSKTNISPDDASAMGCKLIRAKLRGHPHHIYTCTRKVSSAYACGRSSYAELAV